MTYIFIATGLVLASLLLGAWKGRPIAAWCARHPWIGGLLVVGGTLGWFALAAIARGYAEGDGYGWGVAEWFAHRGKWFVFLVGTLFLLTAAVQTVPLGRSRAIALVALEVLVIWLFAWRTLPSYVWLPRGLTRDPEGNIRQTIEHTCAPVCLGNLLELEFGIASPTERELARLSGTTSEGTPLRGLIRAAAGLGLELTACEVMDLAELEIIGGPCLVQISTIPEVRHETLLMRVGPESLEFVDPSYGRRTVTRERFQRIWYGKTLTFLLTPEVAE